MSLPGRRGFRSAVSARQTGFSLLELIVVLILVGLVLAAVAPSFSNGFGGLQLETCGRDMITLMKLARSEAIGQQRTFRMVLGDEDETSTRYVLTDDFGQPIKEYRLPKGYAFQVPDQETLPLTVSFYANGTSSGGQFSIKNAQGKQMAIYVNEITGFAKWSRGEQRQ